MGIFARPKRRTTSGPMPGASVRVLGIEVAQAIQNLDNRAPLIRGKDTVVRLYLQPTGFAKKQSIQGELAIAPSPGAPAQYVASANTIELGGEPPANWWTPLLSSEEEREGVEWARDVVNLPMSSSGRQ